MQLEWSQPEFRAGLQAVLELIRPSRRKQKLILITSVPQSMLTMDPIMDILTRTCTVISWDDRRFWDKLRFAMPDIGKNSPVNKAPHRKAINIRYTPAPTNPSAPTATWPKRLNSEVCVQYPAQSAHSPNHSTYNTEDELSTASSPQYEAPTLHHAVGGGHAMIPFHLHHPHAPSAPSHHIPLQQQQQQQHQHQTSHSPHLQTYLHHPQHHQHQHQQQHQHHQQGNASTAMGAPVGYYRTSKSNNTNTLGHVYSTIPESQYNTHHSNRSDSNRPYFV